MEEEDEIKLGGELEHTKQLAEGSVREVGRGFESKMACCIAGGTLTVLLAVQTVQKLP